MSREEGWFYWFTGFTEKLLSKVKSMGGWVGNEFEKNVGYLQFRKEKIV